MSSTEWCNFCGGLIARLTGDPAGDMRMHVLSVRHRDTMRQAAERRFTVREVVEDDEPERAPEAPMRHLVGPEGVICQGCRRPVEVCIYLGRPVSLHPNGSLACPAPSVAPS